MQIISFITIADEDPQNRAKCVKSEHQRAGKIILWKNEEFSQALLGILRKATISFVMFARQHGEIHFPLVTFS
jgi:hypothetical protein